MKRYKILITPLTKTGGREDAPYTIELETDRLEWSIEQYQRNRAAFSWEVVDEN